jgi:hypothetical protein
VHGRDLARAAAGRPYSGFPAPARRSNASLALPCRSGGEAGGEESSVSWDDLKRQSTNGCLTPVSDRIAAVRIQEHARIRARESRVSREMVTNYSRPIRLLQLVLMPARMRDLLPTPLPNLNIAQWDEPPALA